MKTFRWTVPEPNHNYSKTDQSRSFRFVGTWIAFFLFHLSLTVLDWKLRDYGAGHQPMAGGIPETIDAILMWGSLVPFCYLLYISMPLRIPSWLRAMLTAIQVASAVLMLAIARVYYVLTNGIDTL